MRVYTFSEARQRLAELLDMAKSEDVVIKRRNGETFVLSCRKSVRSPFDIAGVDVPGVSTKDIVAAVRESRSGRSSRSKRASR